MPKPPASKIPTVSFVSLGCSKNLVDSERMLGLLAQDGYAIVPDAQPSDLVVVNTCGFIDAARQESIGVIEEMLEQQAPGTGQGRDRRRLPGRAAARGPARAVPRGRPRRRRLRPRGDRPGGRPVAGGPERAARGLPPGARSRRRTTAPGCGSPRGTWPTSRSPRAATATARSARSPSCGASTSPSRWRWSSPRPRSWPSDGVRELVLVAQDMTYYGVDLYGRPRLAELLRELEKVEGIDWIRILYCYPQFFTDELYDVLGHAKKIIPYLDMPLQHINDRMLKLMNRRHTRAETEAIIGRLRATIPGLALRTTFIVGFPGETDAEFAELVDFVEATRFERLGGVHLLARARHAGGQAARPPARRADRIASRPPDGRAAADRLRVQPGPGGQDPGRDDRRPDARGPAPLDRPDVRRLARCRRRGPRARRPVPAGRHRPLRDRRLRGIRPDRPRLARRAAQARKARPRPRRRPAASSLAILDDV